MTVPANPWINRFIGVAVVSVFFSLLISCEKQETSLGTMEGRGAVLSQGRLLVVGADRAHRDIEGKSFSCPETMTVCRRAVVVLYDASFRRVALFEKDFSAVNLGLAAYPRGAGGYYLVATDETWIGGERQSRPFFQVTLVVLSAALDEMETRSFRSTPDREIHAAFVTTAGELYLAGLDGDGALLVERFFAEAAEGNERWLYPPENGGRVVFLAAAGGAVHLVRSTSDGGYRYLLLDGAGPVMNVVALGDGDALDPEPEVGVRGVAAVIRNDGLYWFGHDDVLYRISSGNAPEILATLDTGEGFSYQRDLRFVEGDLYLIGANDRAVHGSGCGYGEIMTHETELVVAKFDASFERIWEDRETEGADYRAIEVIAWGKKRYFLFQKDDRVLIRPTD